MNIKIIKKEKFTIAQVEDAIKLLCDEQSALDLIGDISYHYEVNHLIINKEILDEDFFDLRTGIAGNILQKFVNYSMRLAIVGDFSMYQSNNLRRFILESNKGKQVFFASSAQEAIENFVLINNK